jgi:hypothetical protein
MLKIPPFCVLNVFAIRLLWMKNSKCCQNMLSIDFWVVMGVKATYVVILALGLRPKQGLAKV